MRYVCGYPTSLKNVFDPSLSFQIDLFLPCLGVTLLAGTARAREREKETSFEGEKRWNANRFGIQISEIGSLYFFGLSIVLSFSHAGYPSHFISLSLSLFSFFLI